MKILSWNIGGAHTFTEKVSDGLHYEKEDFQYFVDQIKQTKSDIVLLQEAHSSDSDSHGKVFAEQLSYPFYTEYSYGASHIKKGNQLTLVTLSKYPIEATDFHLLPNPKLTIKRPNGDIWVSLDVGFLITEVSFNGRKINVANCHLVPFHYFKRDFAESEFENIRKDIVLLFEELAKKPSIVGGDFNYHDLRQVIPTIFADYLLEEAFENTETAPGKGQQDHILFSNHWELGSVQVAKAQTDHYKCMVEVELKHV